MSRLKSVFLLTVILVSLVYGQLPPPFPDRLAIYKEQNRTLPSECDFVVVGCGLAGSVLAKRLSSGQRSVCVLETGPSDIFAFIHMPLLFGAISNPVFGLDWNYFSTFQPGLGRAAYLPRGKVLAGTGARNAMVYNRDEKIQFNLDYQGLNGWSWNDMLPYFKKSENQQNVALDPTYHGFNSNSEWFISEQTYTHNATKIAIDAMLQAQVPFDVDHSDGTHTGVRLNQVFIKYGQRHSTAQAFLTPDVIERPNLFIQTLAQATKINMNDGEAKSVSFVQTYLNEDGSFNRTENKVVKAKKAVVLSAGVYNSPQLLLLSGIGPREHLESVGIEVVSNVENVGLNLQDHNMVGMTYEVSNDTDSYDEDIAPANIGTNIGKWYERLGLPSSLGYSPIASNVPEGASFHKSTNSTTQHSDYQILLAPGSFISDGFKSAADFGAQKAFTFGCVNMRPKARGTVRLANSNPLTPPLIDHKYLENQYDIDILLECMEKVDQIVTMPAIASRLVRRLVPAPNCNDRVCRTQYLRDYLMSGYHPTSTLNIQGDKPVVNKRLRVKKTENIYVADASVLAAVPIGNPSSSIVAVSEKASDMLCDEYNC